MKAIVCFGIGCFITFVILLPILENLYSQRAKIPVDLPTEWRTISQDKNKPDILVAHLSGDTLYLRFDN